MSGIFGIFHSDDRPINQSHLQKMAGGIAHRGPDGTKTITKPHIGFGHSMLHTTPESLLEILPYTDPESGITITADARIDNREELSAKLGLQLQTTISDSQIIVEGFKRWGTDCLLSLLGDFAFALWEPSKQQLFCARDYIGVKPFYYHHSPTQFVFSSEIKQLAELPEIPLPINEGIVAEYLACSFCSRTETLFRDIERLAPGHYLTITPDKFQIHKYWTCEASSNIYYKKSADYTEQFLELFNDAVCSRMRSHGRVSAELSGGLDSSCVVSMANMLLSKKKKAPLKTYSMVFPGLPCDEKQHIDTLLQHCNLSPNYVPVLNYQMLEDPIHSRANFLPCDVPNLAITTPLFNAIKKDNSRIVLSGIGGDQCFTGSSYPYIDYIQHKKIRLFCKDFLFNTRKNQTIGIKNIAYSLGWPLTPLYIKKLLIKRVSSKNFPPWLSQKFISTSQIATRRQNTDPRSTLSNLSKVFHQKAFGPTQQYALEAIDNHRAQLQVESRHPFLDRRIVEFALSIPSYEHQRIGEFKLLLRQRNNFLLPLQISDRVDKAEFSFLINTYFQKTIFNQNFKEEPICNLGWINSKSLQGAIDQIKELVNNDILTRGNKTWEIWFAYSLNSWYNKFIMNTYKRR